MKHHKHILAALAAASLLLSGCAAATGSVGQANTVALPSSSPSASTPAAAEPGHTGGHNHGSTPSPAAAQAQGPSEAALMVCGDQPMDRLTSILKLETKPHTVNNWADSTFTCTYHLTEGALEISVQEATDQASARTYFDAMQALAKDAKPIQGLANLGFPAYETADGSAVFQKDTFVLHVDASGLPATLGPNNITRNALAYQLSTTILACWVEHH
ncbi:MULTISPECIES: hypothetical protein [unclassified Arthrobacter]|uniref:hypothetical protein n=1 Tax=unclassified Arthrobacter TaxID=235627 RepID=UPI002E03BB03|nr:hypothetical protein [Arthrobacter sp. MP_M4]